MIFLYYSFMGTKIAYATISYDVKKTLSLYKARSPNLQYAHKPPTGKLYSEE